MISYAITVFTLLLTILYIQTLEAKFSRLRSYHTLPAIIFTLHIQLWRVRKPFDTKMVELNDCRKTAGHAGGCHQIARLTTM